MIVKVCVGSSCHLKGSYLIIQRLQELIKENHLEDEVQLKGSFCMGKCINGIPLEIDGQIVLQVGITNIDEVFEKYILKKGE
ncbi:MAG: NAD(P)H-dependent oxidoreductase subunit E [Erysipelotrichales bacterium]|nr:NAD(P)H-dependent oxidoreductase subunit E [Erysipelotrichales bacterium]